MPASGEHTRSPDPGAPGTTPGPATTPAPARRLPRAQRRDQILTAATRAFARAGFSATSLDDIAAEAGISRVILYRHFDSKADLYRAVLGRVGARLSAATGTRDFTSASITALVEAAAKDPDGYRLLFRHAAREPEFRAEMDRSRAHQVAIAHRELLRELPDSPWVRWAADLAPTITLEAVMAWLDAGQPDPDQAADRIRQAVEGLIQAARSR
jgi:AcrR family transcriptional regulator